MARKSLISANMICDGGAQYCGLCHVWHIITVYASPLSPP